MPGRADPRAGGTGRAPWRIDSSIKGRPLAVLFRLVVTLTVVAGWVLMAIGVALFISEGPDTPHDRSYLVYAAGFCSAAIASPLTAVRLRTAVVVALPFAGLGVWMLRESILAGLAVGLSCRGGCPPDYAHASQTVFDVFWAACADLLVAPAIVVVPLIRAIIRRAAMTPPASSDDAECPT